MEQVIAYVVVSICSIAALCGVLALFVSKKDLDRANNSDSKNTK
jgi:hypothetical protein